MGEFLPDNERKAYLNSLHGMALLLLQHKMIEWLKEHGISYKRGSIKSRIDLTRLILFLQTRHTIHIVIILVH
jgi:hypothetical protein